MHKESTQSSGPQNGRMVSGSQATQARIAIYSKILKGLKPQTRMRERDL